MIRLILLVLLFLTSLLAVFNAPEYHLWMLAIAVSEYPLPFTLIILLVTGAGIFRQRYCLAGTVIGVVTLFIAISPIVCAYLISTTLKADMISAFGPTAVASPSNNLLSFKKLIGSTNPVIPYKTYTYANYPDISLQLDYYPAQTAGKRPCVVVVHGGSWSGGDSKQLPELNSYLAAAGYQVAAINYRLAPAYRNPAPVEDVKQALAYLRKHAHQLHIDTNNFVLLGRSAGAQIALLAAYTLHNNSIKGVIDFYGPADMVWGYSLPASPLVMDSRAVMGRYLGGNYEQVPANYAASSPVEFVDSLATPTLLIHGANDVLVAYEHSTHLSKALKTNGIKHYWLKLPWATHGFDYNLNGPGGQLSTYAVEAFLNAVTR